jgi:hypothetical protein
MTTPSLPACSVATEAMAIDRDVDRRTRSRSPPSDEQQHRAEAAARSGLLFEEIHAPASA